MGRAEDDQRRKEKTRKAKAGARAAQGGAKRGALKEIDALLEPIAQAWRKEDFEAANAQASDMPSGSLLTSAGLIAEQASIEEASRACERAPFGLAWARVLEKRRHGSLRLHGQWAKRALLDALSRPEPEREDAIGWLMRAPEWFFASWREGAAAFEPGCKKTVGRFAAIAQKSELVECVSLLLAIEAPSPEALALCGQVLLSIVATQGAQGPCPAIGFEQGRLLGRWIGSVFREKRERNRFAGDFLPFFNAPLRVGLLAAGVGGADLARKTHEEACAKGEWGDALAQEMRMSIWGALDRATIAQWRTLAPQWGSAPLDEWRSRPASEGVVRLADGLAAQEWARERFAGAWHPSFGNRLKSPPKAKEDARNWLVALQDALTIRKDDALAVLAQISHEMDAQDEAAALERAAQEGRAAGDALAGAAVEPDARSGAARRL